MVYDKMLEDRLQEMRELSEWKNEELEKCAAAKSKAIQMFNKLKLELEEMKSIANPSVAMDVKSGKLHQVSFTQMSNSHLTATIDAASEEHKSRTIEVASLPSHVLVPARQVSVNNSQMVSGFVSGLVADTQDASRPLYNCMSSAGSSHVALFVSSYEKPKKSDEESGGQESYEKPKKSDEECQAEKAALEKTYVKAYVELSRLKAEYEELANSTACVDTAMEQFKNRRVPLQQQASKLASAINEEVQNLQSLRPRLEAANSAESKLKKQVEDLSRQCSNLGPTVSDLSKVRDAIKALSSCPGLSRVEFSLPKWVGTWASFNQDGKAQTDEEQDKLMHAACRQVAPGSRAAEVDEI